jgi:hypothetical protein
VNAVITTPTARISRRTVLAGTSAALLSVPSHSLAQVSEQSLPSWNDGPAKRAILDFIRATTDQASRNFVAPEDRVATFDQDGTLWVEHPAYSQAMFALDRVHAMAPHHPDWKDREPFKAVLSNDMAAVAKFSERDWAEIVFLTHSGMSQAEFQGIARQWLAAAQHPRFKRLYTELVYQPMREVMELLRVNGGAVASCVGIADDASGLVKVVVSGGAVNRCLLGECLAEALPSIDLAHGDLA